MPYISSDAQILPRGGSSVAPYQESYDPEYLKRMLRMRNNRLGGGGTDLGGLDLPMQKSSASGGLPEVGAIPEIGGSPPKPPAPRKPGTLGGKTAALDLGSIPDYTGMGENGEGIGPVLPPKEKVAGKDFTLPALSAAGGGLVGDEELEGLDEIGKNSTALHTDPQTGESVLEGGLSGRGEIPDYTGMMARSPSAGKRPQGRWGKFGSALGKAFLGGREEEDKNASSSKSKPGRGILGRLLMGG